jgi:hypothetical protein
MVNSQNCNDAGDECGGAVWPSCSGWCPEGTVCQSGASYPCACRAPTTCADRIRDSKYHWPNITHTSDTTAIILWADYTDPVTVPDHLLLQIAPQTAKGAFRNNCSSGDCIFNTEITDLLDGPNFVNITGLTPGTLYTVHYEFTSLCVLKEEYYLSSCKMTPDPLQIASVGQTGVLTPQIDYDSADTAMGIDYVSDDPGVATVSNRAYQLIPGLTRTTTVTGLAVGRPNEVANIVYFHDTSSKFYHRKSGLSRFGGKGDKINPCPSPTLTANILPGKSAPASSASRNALGFPSVSSCWG